MTLRELFLGLSEVSMLEQCAKIENYKFLTFGVYAVPLGIILVHVAGVLPE